ncbi:MAG TPA: HAMP domain-containing sensor histidine kinase [Virgibacillus sp.]|nr:HAMP domain-containing sensor histidine kinase [Virgibacillus sp.]
MGTLYVRIIATTMGIMIASALFSFIATNIYYHYYLKPVNDQKVTEIAKDTVEIFEKNKYDDPFEYLTVFSDLGYQFYLIDQHGNAQMFGDPFRKYDLADEHVDSVLNGETYHGISNYPWKIFVTGFFDNELQNTIGEPIQVNGETNALFIRPNTTQQFGEMRFFLAVLLILALLFSFLFVLVSTTFIVRPIKRLTEATKKIAAGNYHLKLKVNRKDEIGRLSDDFTKMSDRLNRTEEKRQEFVSNVSHEIQSPLTSIQGFSQALREEELPEEDRDRYLGIIEKESRRLSVLSKQLLTLSFLDSELSVNDMVVLDVGAQLKEVVSMTEYHWREKDITIEMDLSSNIILGEPRLLQQVWMNLITNAIRYTDPGGMIVIQTVKGREEVTISVKDTGIGIKQEDLSQLFERFYKVDKARVRTENNTGLGLSIVKRIVDLHGGMIMVDSELGKGSEFHVILKLKDAFYL